VEILHTLRRGALLYWHTTSLPLKVPLEESARLPLICLNS
jgi:hypothetical protein